MQVAVADDRRAAAKYPAAGQYLARERPWTLMVAI